MNICFHIGAHGPASRAINLFLDGHKVSLDGIGVFAPPVSYIQNQFMPLLNSQIPIDQLIDTVQRWVRQLEEQEAYNTIACSVGSFFCGKRGIFRGETMFPNLEEKIGKLGSLFSNDSITIHLSIEDMGTFVPNVIKAAPPSVIEKIRNRSVKDFSWVPVVKRISESCPQAKLFIWPSEDYSQIADPILEAFLDIEKIGPLGDTAPSRKLFEKLNHTSQKGLKILSWSQNKLDSLEARFLDDLEELETMECISFLERNGSTNVP